MQVDISYAKYIFKNYTTIIEGLITKDDGNYHHQLLQGGKDVIDVPEDISYAKYVQKNAVTIFEDLIVKDNSNLSHQVLQGLTWERDNSNYVKEFHLNKRLTYNLVLGYDSILRQKVVDRWLELGEYFFLVYETDGMQGGNDVCASEDITYYKDIIYYNYVKKNAVEIFEDLIVKDGGFHLHQQLQGLTWERIDETRSRSSNLIHLTINKLV